LDIDNHATTRFIHFVTTKPVKNKPIWIPKAEIIAYFQRQRSASLLAKKRRKPISVSEIS